MVLEGKSAAYALVLALCFAAVVIYIIYSKSGWSVLSSAYASKSNFKGSEIRGTESSGIDLEWYVLWQTDTASSYKCRIIIKANEDGLYLRPSDFFDLVHSPVFIPWGDVSDQDSYNANPSKNTKAKTFVVNMLDSKTSKPVFLSFKKTPSICLQIPRFIALKIKTVAKDNWNSKYI